MRHLLFIQVCPFYYLIFRKRRKAAADLKREQDEQALVDGEEDMDVNDDDATKVSVCWMIINSECDWSLPSIRKCRGGQHSSLRPRLIENKHCCCIGWLNRPMLLPRTDIFTLTYTSTILVNSEETQYFTFVALHVRMSKWMDCIIPFPLYTFVRNSK